MDFKTQKIRPHSSSPKNSPNLNPFKKSSETSSPRKINQRNADSKLKMYGASIATGLLVIVILIFGISQIIKSLDFSSIVFSFGNKLQTGPTGKTNVLLLGIGGEGHDGGNLTDTMVVASIDFDKKSVSMLSIPRDFYLDTKLTGKSKINSVFASAKTELGSNKEALDYTKQVVSKITNLPIQYYVKVDFGGFVKLVDSMDGVDVTLEENINDYEYPKGETTKTESFIMKAGEHHLDGETALKYARSRHGTNQGDYDRARRQQDLLFAIKEKALSLNILTDPGKIKGIYDSINESIETNLTFPEIIELAKYSKDFQKDKLANIVMNDDPTSCGGLVYTPAREYFGGASVALPVGTEYEYLHFFIENTFNNAEAIQKQEPIQVRNGTKTAGLALEVLNLLSRFCLNTIYYGNNSDVTLETTTIYFRSHADENGTEETSTVKPTALPLIQALIPNAEVVEGIPEEYLASEKTQDSEIVILLGKDYLKNRLPDPWNKLRYLAPATPVKTITQETTPSKQTSSNPTSNSL